MTMSKELNKHMTKGGPGDKFLGGGKVDTSKWFENLPDLEKQIKDEEIWFSKSGKFSNHLLEWENLHHAHGPKNKLDLILKILPFMIILQEMKV